jgi:hypothetical protein
MQEGVIQALYLRNSSIKTPLLAAVGPLQFEVVQFRLESEYGAVSRLEAAPWTVVRWLPVDMKEDDLDALSLPTGARLAYDVGKSATPFGRDGAANGMVLAPGPGHVANGLRVDDDFFEARAVRCVLDSGEVVVKPFLDLAEHEVILRRGTPGVPRLGQAGRAHFQLQP